MVFGMKDFFNPDFEIYGGKYGYYDAVALTRAVRAECNRIEFDAEKDCPYDKMLCRQKLVRINDWVEWLDWLAKSKKNIQFCTRGDMFHGCPVPQLNCIRRARYEQMLEKVKEEQK